MITTAQSLAGLLLRIGALIWVVFNTFESITITMSD